MKRVRLDRWAIQLQPPRNPRLHLLQQRCPFSHETRSAPRRRFQQRQDQVQHQWQYQRRHAASRRKASSAAAAQVEEPTAEDDDFNLPRPPTPNPNTETNSSSPLNTPSHTHALRSAKLSALHARLSLPSSLPLQTLARCLIDPSVDPRPGYNNAPLALLGQDLLGYYTAEWLLCHYPRLPMPVLFAAQYAYVGSKTLAAMRAEWGVEVVAAPGKEVDAGLLQLRRVVPPGNAMEGGGQMRVKDMPLVKRLGRGAGGTGSGRRNEEWNYRRGMSSRIVYDDQFGDLQTGLPEGNERPFTGPPISSPAGSTTTYPPLEGVEKNALADDGPSSIAPSNLPQTSTETSTLDQASASFIRSLFASLYLHTNPTTTKSFHKSHILSRHLPLHTLFHFTHPTRDLSRLCAREGFEPPVARLISETGRLSRSPVFVVGVYSGGEKLGEGAGSSLNEGRVRAAAEALRGWYLYSPPEGEVMVPSEMEMEGMGGGRKKEWKAQVVDVGEIVT